MSKFSDEEIEAEVNRYGRLNNPKWYNEIWGYKTFHEDQKKFLRGEAVKRLEAQEQAYKELSQELGPRPKRKRRDNG